MSLYGLLHGQNPMSGLLLAVLGLTRDQTGRFRDIYPDADGTHIILYTRNGGGNRDCWHEEDPEFGGSECKHHDEERETDEIEEVKLKGGLTTFRATGQRIVKTYHICEAPNSVECSCPGCIVNYRLPTHPNYVKDWDDDFDSTYAYIEFAVPDGFASLVQMLATGGMPTSVAERFEATMQEMQGMSPEQLRADPRFGPVAQMIGGIVQASAAQPRQREGENDG